MDPAPNCAICNAPAYPECPCESDRLQIALQQAEHRAMDQRLSEIRTWVIEHSRTHILQAFERLTSARKAAHTAYLSSLPYYSIYMQYSGHPPLHPQALATLQQQISDAHAELKRGIDMDWRASVLRYPEILDYFYSLVKLQLPSERDSNVAEPPFAVAGYADRGYEKAEPRPAGSTVREGKKKSTKSKERRESIVEPPRDVPQAPPNAFPSDRARIMRRESVNQRAAPPTTRPKTVPPKIAALGIPPVPTPPVHTAYGHPNRPGSYW